MKPPKHDQTIESRLQRLERRCRALSYCLAATVLLIVSAGAAATVPGVLGAKIKPLRKIFVQDLVADRVWAKQICVQNDVRKPAVKILSSPKAAAIVLDLPTGEKQWITIGGLKQAASMTASVKQLLAQPAGGTDMRGVARAIDRATNQRANDATTREWEADRRARERNRR
jgi:hypothetical protein